MTCWRRYAQPGRWFERATQVLERTSVTDPVGSFSATTPEKTPGRSSGTGRLLTDGGTERTQPGPDEEIPDWEAEVSAETPADLSVGDQFVFAKTLSEEDVRGFARASGDTNPLHLDGEYAEQTRFDGRIVHGTLVAGLVSAALARMPGVVVYLSQDLEFHAPARIGERVTADCELIEVRDDSRYRLSTVVHREGTTLIDGEAVVLVDDSPENG